MRVFVTGATGLVGSRLCAELAAAGDVPVGLSRRARNEPGVEWVQGEVSSPGPWQQAVDGCDAVVHLAGESIASGRWTPRRKQELSDSRILSTRQIVAAMREAHSPPRVLVNGSAVGFYGPRGSEELDESSAPGKDFLAGLCVAWEREAQEAVAFGTRVVCLRLGVVLSGDGGALSKMALPFRLGAGGSLGPPGRWFPWVHEADVTSLIRFALREPLTGSVNVVAPQRVTMGDFAKTLGRVMHRPALLPVPLFALRILMGELADSLSPGQKVRSRAAAQAGFQFQFPELEAALRACLSEDA